MSTDSSEYRLRKSGIAGAMCNTPKDIGALIRKVPRGSPCSRETATADDLCKYCDVSQ